MGNLLHNINFKLGKLLLICKCVLNCDKLFDILRVKNAVFFPIKIYYYL